MNATTEPRSLNDYTIGWVCALPKEQTASIAMLDERHTDFVPRKPPGDTNNYSLGSIGKHNIVIACLPIGQSGTSSAATVAIWMVSTFPRIRFGLLVGIGGGIPPKVRLGDVVVGIPTGQFPGVVQWAMGKATDGNGGKFERIGSLNNPPTLLLSALSRLESEHELTGSKIPEYFEALGNKFPKLVPKYLRSSSHKDILFRADYSHIDNIALDEDEGHEEEEEEEESCPLCDKSKIVRRRSRDACVHYGLIASGNQAIKDAKFRVKLNMELDSQVLCIDTEAAGLVNNFPCVVIRGICDYADSHKNDDWQEHAAAMAAALAKELLQYVLPADVEREPAVKDVLSGADPAEGKTEEEKKAEEDRKRAEEERKRAEEGRKRAEEERKRAEEERKRAEEEEKAAGLESTLRGPWACDYRRTSAPFSSASMTFNLTASRISGGGDVATFDGNGIHTGNPFVIQGRISISGQVSFTTTFPTDVYEHWGNFDQSRGTMQGTFRGVSGGSATGQTGTFSCSRR
jgi:nucleoside phosphorylase